MTFYNSKAVIYLTNGFIREMETNSQTIYIDIIKLIEKYMLLLSDTWDKKLSDEKFVIDTKLNSIQYKSSVDLSSSPLLDSFAFGIQVISSAKNSNFKHWKFCILPDSSNNNVNSGGLVRSIIGILPNEMCQTLMTSNSANFLGQNDKTNGFGFFSNSVFFANHRKKGMMSTYFKDLKLKYGMIFEMVFDLREDNDQGLLKFIIDGTHGEYIAIDLTIDKIKEYRMLIALDKKTDVVQILQ